MFRKHWVAKPVAARPCQGGSLSTSVQALIAVLFGSSAVSARVVDGQRTQARECQRRHELVLRFLRFLGVSEEIALIDSEGIEHHVSAETLDRIRVFLDKREAP